MHHLLAGDSLELSAQEVGAGQAQRGDPNLYDGFGDRFHNPFAYLGDYKVQLHKKALRFVDFQGFSRPS